MEHLNNQVWIEIVKPKIENTNVAEPSNMNSAAKKLNFPHLTHWNNGEQVNSLHCDFCEKNFYSQTYFKNHFDTKHPEKSNLCEAPQISQNQNKRMQNGKLSLNGMSQNALTSPDQNVPTIHKREEIS